MSDDSRSPSSRRHPEPEACIVCAGDGRLQNAWGQVAKCPSCHGSGRRSKDTGFHDVTKTKESHHRAAAPGAGRAAVVEKQTWPSTSAGAQLATEIKNAPALSAEVKAKLTREIIDHEATHGQCTKTFLKKVRKQFRPQP